MTLKKDKKKNRKIQMMDLKSIKQKILSSKNKIISCRFSNSRFR